MSDDSELVKKPQVEERVREPFVIETHLVSTKLKEWQGPRSLKQTILESKDPWLQPYRKLLEIKPELADSELRHLLTTTSRDNVITLLQIYELSGRLLYDLRDDTLTLEKIQRYYRLLQKYRELFQKIDDDTPSVRWSYDVSGTKYEANLYVFWPDGRPLPVKLYEDMFQRPTIGLQHSELPCYQILLEEIEKTKQTFKNKLESDSLEAEDFSRLRHLLSLKQYAESSIQRFDPLSWFFIAPEYLSESGVINKTKLLINTAHALCNLCNNPHTYLLLGLLKRK